LVKEFKEFALKGPVVDLAVAFLLGVTFNGVVQSFVNDVLMNLIAALFGQPDFSALELHLGEGEIGYGAFITALVNFALVAAVLFALVKVLNRLRRPKGAAPEPPATRECPYCLTAIPVAATRCGACTSEVATA
jgi:large conductance mechanosensitive channel